MFGILALSLVTLNPQADRIRVHGTIAPGLQAEQLNIYLHGATDIYISEAISLRGRPHKRGGQNYVHLGKGPPDPSYM